MPELAEGPHPLRPVAGAVIEAAPSSGAVLSLATPDAAGVRSGVDGGFVVRGLGPGPHELMVSHPDYAAA